MAKTEISQAALDAAATDGQIIDGQLSLSEDAASKVMADIAAPADFVEAGAASLLDDVMGDD